MRRTDTGCPLASYGYEHKHLPYFSDLSVSEIKSYYVAQAGIKLGILLPAPASQVLLLQECYHTPGLDFFFICLSTGECQDQEVGVGGWGSG